MIHLKQKRNCQLVAALATVVLWNSGCHAQGLMPEKQRAFCELFATDEAAHKARAKKIAAAKNPIEKRMIEMEPDTTDSMFRSGQARVMGNGAFTDWIGTIHIMVSDQNMVFVSIKTPCGWSDHRYDSYNHIYFGSGFEGMFKSIPSLFLPEGFDMKSGQGQALKTVTENEGVSVSGQLLRCSPAGCRSTTNDSWFLAHITTIRLRKSGAVIKLHEKDE